MNDADVMYLARDTTAQVVGLFDKQPFDDHSNIGSFVVGVVTSTGHDGRELVKPRIVPARSDELEVLRDQLRTVIEEAIQRAVDNERRRVAARELSANER